MDQLKKTFLTACNPKKARLRVQGEQLQAHRAGQRQRHPADKKETYSGGKFLYNHFTATTYDYYL